MAVVECLLRDWGPEAMVPHLSGPYCCVTAARVYFTGKYWVFACKNAMCQLRFLAPDFS